MTSAPVTDGRTVRSQKTRVRVLDALLALVGEDNPRPTAREIAERAGVSLRSVYVHFEDLEDLFVAAANRQIELLAPLYEEVSDTGSLPERATALMTSRGRIWEATSPVRRAAEMHAPTSKALTSFMKGLHRNARRELERVFARELERLPSDVRRRRLATLGTITGGVAWRELRTTGGLDVADAHTATIEAIVELLETAR